MGIYIPILVCGCPWLCALMERSQQELLQPVLCGAKATEIFLGVSTPLSRQNPVLYLQWKDLCVSGAVVNFITAVSPQPELCCFYIGYVCVYIGFENILCFCICFVYLLNLLMFLNSVLSDTQKPNQTKNHFLSPSPPPNKNIMENHIGIISNLPLFLLVNVLVLWTWLCVHHSYTSFSSFTQLTVVFIDEF